MKPTRSFADIAASGTNQKSKQSQIDSRSQTSTTPVNSSASASSTQIPLNSIHSPESNKASNSPSTGLSLGMSSSSTTVVNPEKAASSTSGGHSLDSNVSPNVISPPSMTPPMLTQSEAPVDIKEDMNVTRPNGSSALADKVENDVLNMATPSANKSRPTSAKDDHSDQTWPKVASLTLEEKHSMTRPLEKLSINPSTSLLQKALARSAINDRETEDAASNSSFSESPLFPPSFNERFLFDDEADSNSPTSSYVKKYLQLNTDDDKFPILVRRDSFPGMLSASSAALDLAPLSQTPPRQSRILEDLMARNSEWPQFTSSTTTSSQLSAALSPKQASLSSPPVQSISTNRVPSLTINNSRDEELAKSETDSVESSAIQPGSRVFSQSDTQDSAIKSGSNNFAYNHSGTYTSLQQSPANNANQQVMTGNATNLTPFVSAQMPNGNATVATAHTFHGGSAMMYAIPAYPGNSSHISLLANCSMTRNVMQTSNPNTVHASNGQAASGKGTHKRGSNDPDANRFAGVNLEDLVGDIYSLCKDQHGCRYLQKKLEEGNESYLNIIFNEVFSHFVELMTDPFGNYLCQKLLEHCKDDQRTIIVETVSSELVNISLNMHGTRAVQKLIEYLSAPQQIHMVVTALNANVVTLIKDLNGNHVIQKCLNRLSSDDDQFIYNAVSQNCVEVATHRHGCCVLQRCIDHASEAQKIQLVTEITYNALPLVQDPFGNYVVQYVLDLNEPRFTDNLIRRFIGNVCLLSVQKFSSNVMEKCIRVAQPDTRKYLIDEMLNKTRLEKLLRDSYANYVVQTSLDCADQTQRQALVECIRPLLPAIRNTPYGKRIQGKLHREQMQAMSSMPPHLIVGNQTNVPVPMTTFAPPPINGHQMNHQQAHHHFISNVRPQGAGVAQAPPPPHPGAQFHCTGPPPQMGMGMMSYQAHPRLHHQHPSIQIAQPFAYHKVAPIPLNGGHYPTVGFKGPGVAPSTRPAFNNTQGVVASMTAGASSGDNGNNLSGFM